MNYNMAIYQEEERARLGRRLGKEAVALAIQGRWEEAVVVNKSIIEKFPTDIEAYNRLGKALSELGDLAQAREAYLRALEISPYNAIAKKNLARLDSLSGSVAISDSEYQKAFPSRAPAQKVTPGLFITVMGKTGVVNLCNLASGEVLAKLGYGDQVQLVVNGQHLVVESEREGYLGEVEPKHASRLIKLIKGGNEYNAVILRYRENEVQVLIREVYQHPSQVGYLSFPIKGHPHGHVIEGSFPKRVITEESEAEEMEHPEEEAEHFEVGEEFSLEGFSLLDGDTEKEEIEE